MAATRKSRSAGQGAPEPDPDADTYLGPEDEYDDEADDQGEPEFTGPDIGRRKPDHARPELKTFTLYSYDSRGRETAHRMQARPDELDYASLAAFASKKTDGFANVNALTHALRKVLDDEDGIGVNESVRLVVDRDGEWVGADQLADDDAPELDEMRFTLGDNTVWNSSDEAIAHGFTHGSSRRRYEHLTDPENPDRVDASALEGIMRFLLSGGGARPTRSSRRSSRSRGTKKTRSGAG